MRYDICRNTNFHSIMHRFPHAVLVKFAFIKGLPLVNVLILRNFCEYRQPSNERGK